MAVALRIFLSLAEVIFFDIAGTKKLAVLIRPFAAAPIVAPAFANLRYAGKGICAISKGSARYKVEKDRQRDRVTPRKKGGICCLLVKGPIISSASSFPIQKGPKCHNPQTPVQKFD
ncbi:hypothetical protein ACTL6U_06385 [Rhodovibrionaceae bacterium A322]